MSSDALSKVYAKSLYELAEKAGGKGKIVEVGEELEEICELARSDRRFGEFLNSPIIDPERRGASLKKIFANRVTDLALRFLLVLNEKGRLGGLESIASAYDHLVQEAFGRIEVDLFTAGPLGAEQLGEVTAKVRSALGKEPVIHSYVEPGMIGGIKLRIGDQLLDGSVASRLRRMRSELLAEGSVAVRGRSKRILEEGGA